MTTYITTYITICIIAIFIAFKLLEIRYIITNQVSYGLYRGTMITCMIDMIFSLGTLIIYSFVLNIASSNYFTLSCYISCILAFAMAIIALFKG